MNYEYISHLNNVAVTWFQQGHHDCAVKSLVLALNELPFDDFSSSKMSHASTETCENATKGQINHSTLLRSKYMQWVKISTSDKSQEDQVTEGVSMYNHAVILNANYRQHDDDGDNGTTTDGQYISQHAIKASLLYNLAHIHHWRAMHLGISSGLSLALHLYEQAGLSIQRLKDERADQLALAVLNNMGHIHYQLLQFSEARHCFDVLRLMISMRVGSLSLLQTMDDYETFVMSAMLPIPELRLAPAA